MLKKLSANHEDTKLVLNRGLNVSDGNFGGFGVRGVLDSDLLELVDNEKMVRNLFFSQKYLSWSHFLTYTCNKKKHFVTSPIKIGQTVVNGKLITLVFRILILMNKNKLRKMIFIHQLGYCCVFEKKYYLCSLII